MADTICLVAGVIVFCGNQSYIYPQSGRLQEPIMMAPQYTEEEVKYFMDSDKRCAHLVGLPRWIDCAMPKRQGNAR